MNRKQLTLLLVLGVVLGGLGLYVYKKKQSSYEIATEGQKLLQGVLPGAINEVAQINIKQGAAEVNLTRAGELWIVKERGGYPANFATISDTVKKLWDLKITRPVEVGSSRLPNLKLTKSDGTSLDLKDDKGKSIVALTLGLQSAKEVREDAQFGGGSFPSGRYVMRGDDLKSVALVSDPMSIEAKPEDWLSKDWFKVEKVKAVAMTGPVATNNWKLARETESGEWKLAETKPDEVLDNGKASGLNWLLSTPAFNDVIIDPVPEKTGLDKAVTAVVESFDGFTYTFKLGKMPVGEENYAFQFQVAGKFPTERVAGKDEKPEDKSRLDKEFADNRKKLEDKLKNEQAYEKWTYVVSKWTVENLLKERKDFMANKKDETKKDAALPPNFNLPGQ